MKENQNGGSGGGGGSGGSNFRNPPLSKSVSIKEGMTSPTKIIIGSLEKPELYVEAQFNPKEIEVAQNVPWQKPQEANKSNAKNNATSGVNLEFQGTEGRSLTLDLLFDNFEEGNNSRSVSVVDMVKRLQELASVRELGSTQEDKKRPHRCLVVWGEVLPGFKCVISSLSVKYLMFSPQGVPLRAQCTVKVMEADFVSAAKKKR
jgi:hypothetical protein